MANYTQLTLVFLLVLSRQLTTTISLQTCPRLEANSSCSCTSTFFGVQIDCQGNDAQITITVGHNENIVVNCHHADLEAFDFNSLPRINFCEPSRKHISNCSLPQAQFDESTSFQALCLSTANKLTLESSGPVSRAHFKRFHNLKLLTLLSNDLCDFPEDIFDDLVNLTSLSLVSNKLELPLNTRIFSVLHNLKTLSLRKNNLHSLPPGVFRNQKQLQELRLSHSNISNLTKETFEGCYSIKRLYLDSNNIVTFPSDVFSILTKLERVDFDRNYIQSLPEGLFAANKELGTFELTVNNIALKHLPTRFLAALPKLRNVHITCGLETVPEDLFHNSTSIETVNIFKNNLTTLPPGLFAHQIRLTYLDLSRNRLISLADGLFLNTKNLENLILSHNRIASISNVAFSGLTGLRVVHIENNNLREIHFEAFVHAQQLTYLHLQDNRLQFIQLTPFLHLKSLQMLNLRNNSIEAVHRNGLHSDTAGTSPPKYSGFFDLSQNRIHQLDDIVLRALNESRASLALAGNPWTCDCAAQGLINFVQLEHKVIRDIDDVKCVDGRKVLHLSVSNICSADHNFIIAGCAFIVTIGLGAAFCYRYQQQIRVWLYARDMCLWLISEEDLDKEKRYDAFVSYSHRDEDFVLDCLLPEMESGPTPFKICIHIRDWIIGEFIPNQIVQSVADSRRTIIILSPNFIESVWGRLEFRAAHTAALNEGRARVIVVIYGDIGNIDCLDTELKAYLQMNTYIKWGDPWFWKKLRYAMPHPSRTGIEMELVEAE